MRLSKPCLLVFFSVALLGLTGELRAQDVAFRRHTLDTRATNAACAAVDVNHDGQLDVIAGGWWYQAPSFQRHFVRNVAQIRGRFDDYSNLPLDVNGDGWTDLVSANYRSQSIYWVEHPGEELGTGKAWITHVIAEPGPMETGRLADVDGDGRLDLLPNGTTFAAWWEVTEGGQWARHDLPRELAGHGVGFGDIDGDGRGDMVAPGGWAKGPEDARTGRWVWQAEFRLHRDASIPILVHDVDGDGDNDLIWGRGHQIGVYWMEQRARGGRREWIPHAIDTSWTQPHSLLLADIDNDGRQDLVAGKRFMGHDGKDLGEYDPLVICWYSFDPQRMTWQRGVASRGGAAGFGLDPKAADLDGDGDTDLICADRSGLFWLENRLGEIRDRETVSSTLLDEPVPPVDHTQLLVYVNPADDDQTPTAVVSKADWALRRDALLHNLQVVMGPLPDSSRRVPLDVTIISEEETSSYVRRKISYAAEPGDRVPAWLLIPRDLRGRAPAMLCLHQTTASGKDEPAGLSGSPNLHYAHELAERGYVCMVPDYPSFGEYTFDFASPQFAYASGSMKAVWNNVRALDVLELLTEVDSDRIGCIGHSLGAHNGLFTAVFDLRIRVLVTSCGFTSFGDYYGGDLGGWTSVRYMPRIAQRYGSSPSRVPFDFYEIVAAIAPRPLFISAPERDDNFAVGGVKKTVAAARQVYELVGNPDDLIAEHPDCQHHFPDSVRQAAYAWLDERLSGRP